MRVVCRLLFPVLAGPPVFPPQSRFFLWWGAYVDLGWPHPFPLAGLTQGACVSDQGYPPSPLSVTPPPPLTPAGLARGACVYPCPPPSSVPWLHNGGARCLVRVSPYLPWTRTGRSCFWARSARSLHWYPIFVFLTYGPLSPRWTCGCPRVPVAPRRLDHPPAPLAPVSLTCGALARHAWAWRRWDACACLPCCCCPPPCFAVGSVAAPAQARLPCPCHYYCPRSPRCHGWQGIFCPLPAPVRPPLERCLPWGSLWRVCPPGATIPLRGC